jgi:hypothetical protein
MVVYLEGVPTYLDRSDRSAKSRIAWRLHPEHWRDEMMENAMVMVFLL